MTLPAVIAVSEPDAKFDEQGWRHIGTRLTFSGEVEQARDPRVWIGGGEKLLGEFLGKCGFSGRLWRDREFSTYQAYWETVAYVQSKSARFIGSFPAAFIIFEEDTIKLIGTHPAARGLGLARRLIKHCSNGTVTAGTYSDNEAAIALYKSLGMKKVKTEQVYHKP